VVVAVGLTMVEPLADDELKLPGEIEIVVAPLVTQLSVAFAPEFMLAGFAAKEVTDGTEPEFDVEFGALVVLPQPANPTHTSNSGTRAQRESREDRRQPERILLLGNELGELGDLFVVMRQTSLLIAYGGGYWPQGQNWIGRKVGQTAASIDLHNRFAWALCMALGSPLVRDTR
jgi:hypothetical protein